MTTPLADALLALLAVAALVILAPWWVALPAVLPAALLIRRAARRA